MQQEKRLYWCVFMFILFLTVGLGFFVLRTLVYNSDNASAVFIARDILRGNWNLRGWMIPIDNFTTTDILFYLPLVAWKGISVRVIQGVAIAMLTSITGVSLLLASEGLALRRSVVSICIAAAFIVGSSLFFLQNLLTIPTHTGTILYALVCMLLFAKLGKVAKPGLLYGVVFLLTVLGCFGDPLFLAIGVAPILVCILIGLLQKRTKHAEVLFAGVQLVGIFVAHMLVQYVQQQGVLFIDQPFIIAELTGVYANITLFIQIISHSYAADIFGKPLDSAVFPALLNWLKIAAVLLAVRATFRTIRASENVSQTDEVLLYAIGIISLLFLFSSYAQGLDAIRYLLSLIIFLGILLARRWSDILQSTGHTFRMLSLLSICVIGIFLIRELRQAPVPINTHDALVQNTSLAGQVGYGSYWEAEAATLYSKEGVTVWPIKVVDGQFYPYYWLSSTSMYTKPATFIVYSAADAAQFYPAAVHTFGTPVGQQRLENGDTVLTWSNDITPKLSHYAGLER